MHTNGKPWTKLVVPSEHMSMQSYSSTAKRDVPIGSTQNVSVSVSGSRLPAAYDSSPILRARVKHTTDRL
jgi:hypothetical protein